MSSGGKSATGGDSYDYFGSILGGIAYGPLDTLYSLLADGKAIWEGTQNRGAANSVDLTGSIDAKFFAKDGQLAVYYGTSAQTINATRFPNHPNYRNRAFVSLDKFLFGREKSTPPNLQMVAARTPVCPTSLCATGDNVIDDGQINPVAFLGEMFTSLHGLIRAEAELDSTSWLDSAAYCAANKPLTFCSPLFTEPGDFRAAMKSILQMFDGIPFRTSAGKLGLVPRRAGVDPGGLVTIDANWFVEKPKANLGGWGDVPTGYIIRFPDRDRKYKDGTPVKLDNPVALRIRGEQARQTLDYPHVTRRAQAEAIASYLIKLNQHPPAVYDTVLRRERAATLTVGQKILLDVEPDPDVAGLAQLSLIEELRYATDGTIRARFKCDPIADSIPYTNAFTPASPQEADSASIETALVIPLPSMAAGGQTATVGILAARPQDDCTGFAVSFQTDNTLDFVSLGRQEGFALQMTLDAAVLTSGELTAGVTYVIEVNTGATFTTVGAPNNTVGTSFVAISKSSGSLVVGVEYLITNNSGGADFTGVGAANNNVGTVFTATGATPTWGTGSVNTTASTPTWGTGQLRTATPQPGDAMLRLTLTAGENGRDAYLAERTAGDAITAGTDHLLAILANVDVDGRVEIDANGEPELEFCSVVSRAAVDADTHNYTLLRGRKSLTSRAWTTSAQVWIIPGADLSAWSHPDMLALLDSGDPGYIRLASFTAYAEDETDPLPEFEFAFPGAYDVAPVIAWTTPASSPATLVVAGTLSPDATLTDADGNLTRVALFSKNEQTGISTTWFDQQIAPSNSITLQAVFTLANAGSPVGTIDFGTQGTSDQYFTLTLRLTDSAGNIVESTRSLILAGIFGAALGAITYSPPGREFISYLDVGLTAGGASATEIHYAITSWGTTTPASYTIVNATTKQVRIYGTRRLFARASDVTNHSPWQFEDYEYAGSGSGPPL